MKNTRFKPGDLVLFRRVLSIPCEPLKAIVLEESKEYPERWLIDLGPKMRTATEQYAPPYSRSKEIVWPSNLFPYSAEFPFTLDEQYDRFIAYAAYHDLELSKDEFEISADGKELTLDGMDPGECIEAMTMD